MKILFGMNQFSGLVGGSLLPLEVAEYLQSLGHECLIGAHYIADPLQTIAHDANLPLVGDLSTVRAFDFDLVWLQNQTAPLLDYGIGPSSRRRTLFVFAHLSTRTHLEYPGLFHEPALADITLANSAETRAHLIELGIRDDRIEVFPNPAPLTFWADRKTAVDDSLKSATLVSNHPPEEILEVLAILERRGVAVQRIGRGGEARRVTTDLLAGTQMVIAIGKTVQYALARGMPAYVYDRFGGPGYLSEANFASAAHFNFSGRCCNRKIEAAAIAAEIIDRFQEAARFVRSLGDNTLSPFRLEPHIDRLLAMVPLAKENVVRARELEDNRGMMRRERALALAIRENFHGHKSATATARRLRRALRKQNKPDAAPSSG
jgi:hypothetical protein